MIEEPVLPKARKDPERSDTVRVTAHDVLDVHEILRQWGVSVSGVEASGDGRSGSFTFRVPEKWLVLPRYKVFLGALNVREVAVAA